MQKISKYYASSHDGSSTIEVGVNLEFGATSDEAMLPTLLWLFLPYDVTLEEQRESLQQRLAQTLQCQLHAEFAGFRIVDTWLEFYFYAPSAKKFEPLVASLLAQQYAYEIGSYKDTKQKFYFEELYPDKKQLLQIYNREIIVQLQEAGDQCECEREVEHYLLFPTQSHAARALEEALRMKFTCKHEGVNDENALRYTVILTKSHNVSDAVIHNITESLFDLAVHEHGSYEGWSTVLVEKNSL